MLFAFLMGTWFIGFLAGFAATARAAWAYIGLAALLFVVIVAALPIVVVPRASFGDSRLAGSAMRH